MVCTKMLQPVKTTAIMQRGIGRLHLQLIKFAHARIPTCQTMDTVSRSTLFMQEYQITDLSTVPQVVFHHTTHPV
jgi:hypothetical protein